MRNLIKVLEPDRFEDLMALVALYRPGLLSMGQHTEYAERKHGRKPVTYPHPDLEEALRSTYGIIVYQEQVLQIAVRMAGYSLGEADLLRKVMGKKQPELLPPHLEKFVQGAVERGYPEPVARNVFDLIVPFADYGFNAAHACAYGYVAYQTAYLKAHHPVEYMSAVLTSVKDDKDRKPFYLNACRLMGIEVLPPDVNESEQDFTPGRRRAEDPLRAVGGAQRRRRRRGEDPRGARREGRVHGGRLRPFRVRRLLSQGRPRRAHEEGRREPHPGGGVRLAWATRAAASWRRRGREMRRASRRGTRSPDRSSPSARPRPRGSSRCSAASPACSRSTSPCSRERSSSGARSCAFEKEMLGQFVTDHPLLGVQESLAAQTDMPVSELATLGDGDMVTIGGHRRIGAAQVHEARRPLRAVPRRGPRRRRRGRGVPVDLREDGRDHRGRHDPAREGAHRPARTRASDPRRRDPRARARPGGPAAPVDRAPHRRPRGARVHERRDRAREGAARGEPGLHAGRGSVHRLRRRHAARARDLPGRDVPRACSRSSANCSARAPRASRATAPSPSSRPRG